MTRIMMLAIALSLLVIAPAIAMTRAEWDECMQNNDDIRSKSSCIKRLRERDLMKSNDSTTTRQVIPKNGSPYPH